jgi:hypothetical protein
MRAVACQGYKVLVVKIAKFLLIIIASCVARGQSLVALPVMPRTRIVFFFCRLLERVGSFMSSQ